MAVLEIELRLETSSLPPSIDLTNWLSVEVQTANTRPQCSTRDSRRRTEGTHTIIQMSQNPLIRSGGRVIIVRVGETRAEAFMPPIKRVSDPTAGWSKWYSPVGVDPPNGGNSIPAPQEPMFELRYQVRRYGA